MTRWFLGIISMVILVNGCATSRTEFKVIKLTPRPVFTFTATPGPSVEPTPESEATVVPTETTTRKTTVQEYKVQEGDCLWRICDRLFGDPELYPQVATLNQIANPDLIHPGQRLQFKGMEQTLQATVVPKSSPTPTTIQKTKQTIQLTPSATATAVVFPDRVNKAFAPGEKLLFSVEYFGISAGYATLAVHDGPEMYGREIYHIIATARTHPAFEWIFKVRDRIESFFDAQSLFPWRYEKHLREGNYSNDSSIIYDQIQGKVIKDKGRTIIEAPPLVQDVLSVFYYYRTLDIEIGETLSIPVVADNGKYYDVLVKAIRRETVSVPAGKFDCIVVEPYMEFEGVFQHKGKIFIWLTDDKRKVPVLIKSGIIIGTIDIILRDATVVDM
jgi:LysM repeat protein